MRIIIFWMLLFNISCSGIQKAKRVNQYIVRGSQQIRLENKTDSIKINYTGCGGFLIQDNASYLMIDPYFSNVSPLLLAPFKKLKFDTALIDSFFHKTFTAPIDLEGKLKAILISHSHYDHLADIPSLYFRNCNLDSTQIIGSKTTKHILKGAGIDCHPIVMKTSGQEEGSLTKKPEYKSLYSKNGRIRVLPIASEHAPHICGIKLLSSRKENKDFKKFPRKAAKFPEGENYNFLIDFLDEYGQIKFRIFSNAGAACNAKAGFPPLEILEEKQVDVLLLCVAGFSQTTGYPKEIIEFINPRHILLNHWENFFRPISKLQKKPATVPGTNVRKFISKLEISLPLLPEFTLPLPLTEIVFYY